MAASTILSAFPSEQRKKIDTLVDNYQTLQESLRKFQITKQQLLAQQNENESVQNELNILEEDAILYKLVGPILVKQSVPDAKSTVQKRLDYIKQEVDRAEKIERDTTKELEETKTKLETVQKELLNNLQQQQKQL